MFKWKESFHHSQLTFSHILALKSFVEPQLIQERENFPLKTLLDMELDCPDVGACLTLVTFQILLFGKTKRVKHW